jgi:hypothetical protein
VLVRIHHLVDIFSLIASLEIVGQRTKFGQENQFAVVSADIALCTRNGRPEVCTQACRTNNSQAYFDS